MLTPSITERESKARRLRMDKSCFSLEGNGPVRELEVWAFCSRSGVDCVGLCFDGRGIHRHNFKGLRGGRSPHPQHGQRDKGECANQIADVTGIWFQSHQSRMDTCAPIIMPLGITNMFTTECS